MNNLAFENLCQSDQLSTLYTNGIYLGKRKFKNNWAILLRLDSFYVEVVYKKYRGQIQEIYITNSKNILFFYPVHGHGSLLN